MDITYTWVYSVCLATFFNNDYVKTDDEVRFIFGDRFANQWDSHCTLIGLSQKNVEDHLWFCFRAVFFF